MDYWFYLVRTIAMNYDIEFTKKGKDRDNSTMGQKVERLS